MSEFSTSRTCTSFPTYNDFFLESSCTTDLKAAKVFSDTANLLTVGPAQPEDVTGMYSVSSL